MVYSALSAKTRQGHSDPLNVGCSGEEIRSTSASFYARQMVRHGAKRWRFFDLASSVGHETRVIRHGQDPAYGHETHNDWRPRRLNSVWYSSRSGATRKGANRCVMARKASCPSNLARFAPRQ